MEMNVTKKNTAIGLVRRGRPEGRPAVIFDHSPFGMMVSFYETRTTNNEPRLFSRTQMRRTAATDS